MTGKQADKYNEQESQLKAELNTPPKPLKNMPQKECFEEMS
jgi:hypothetical protein